MKKKIIIAIVVIGAVALAKPVYYFGQRIVKRELADEAVEVLIEIREKELAYFAEYNRYLALAPGDLTYPSTDPITPGLDMNLTAQRHWSEHSFSIVVEEGDSGFIARAVGDDSYADLSQLVTGMVISIDEEGVITESGF